MALDSLDRLRTALSGRYRLERELGQGGMATVYLAADVRHGRQVAIKVLRPELAAVLGAERFVVEIKTTAALQHPHILPLFDSGSADGFLYYVMPYIEGETLRTKLDREKQLGIEEAVKITTEVADALDYAHRHGVIHRDIKPENILLHDGRPMVADFGIALAVSAAAGGRMTETGLSLGTPHYMSPEQATAEKDITNRSDVYSLGCVLYEMLTGSPPHVGATAQQIIMKIVTEEAQPVTALRKSVPPNVAAAVEKALEKLPADRFEGAKDFSTALLDPAFVTRPAGVAVGGTRGRGNHLLVATAAVALVAVAVALAGWLRGGPAPPTARFEVALPAGTSLHTGLGLGTELAVSRDGALLAFIGVDSGGTPRLWVKREEDLEARPIPGTEGAYAPFFSPDGSRIGFLREAPRTLNVAELGGGSPHMVLFAGDSAGTALGTSGATWAGDGFIYYDADRSGIRRMRPDGSDRQDVLALDGTKGDIGFAWPEVLPGSDVLVARVRRGTEEPDQFEIVASRIGSGAYTSLTQGVVARYHDGHLFVVSADGTLRATTFDARRLRLRGDSRIVAAGVRVAGDFAGVDLIVDDRGTLHYVAGPAGIGRALEWVDLAGRRTPADPAWLAPWTVSFMVPSPDMRLIVLGTGDTASTSAWIKQLPSGATLPFPTDSGRIVGGGWGADGSSLLLAYRRGGITVVVRRRADGLGRPTTIVRDSLWIDHIHESRDGRWIVADRGDSTGAGRDLVVLEEGRDTGLRPLVATPASEWGPVLSPDGRWLAYESNRSGRMEVYVQPFPDVDRGIWQVSIDGGYTPLWAPSGDRLYFNRPAAGVLAVQVSPAPAFSRPQVVLTQAQLSGTFISSGWGISPDGRRFLTLATVAGQGSVRLVRVEHVMSEVNATVSR
jgi:hypothetical protein